MQESDNSRNNNQVVHGSNKKSQKIKKLYLILILAVATTLIGVTVFFTTRKKESPKPTTENAERSISYTYEESASTEAYGNFLSATLESYKIGGNKNGINVEAHGHYPTEAQVKNKEWAAQNLKLDEGINRLIEQGKLVYTATNCEQEKCTAYTIKADGVEVAKNLN